jgi:hypothetical protein
MCIYICANPTVRLWLNAVTAHAERECLQVACNYQCQSDVLDRDTLPESIVQQIPRGQMLREACWPREYKARLVGDPSLETWKHPFDALANAWSRLLVLVGLRR